MTAYGRFANLYDRLMDDVDYKGWSAYVLSLLADGGVLCPARVVDCACGTGALTIPLAKAGYQLTGLDISEDMLFLAQEKARKAGLGRIPFIRQDMRRIALHRQADGIISACDGVNYLTAPADVQAFFRSAHAALRPGGLLLFDVSSPYKLEHVLGDNTFGEDREDCAYLWQNTWEPEQRLVTMDLTFFLRQGRLYERFTERHTQRAHSQEELKSWLREAGFRDIAVYESFTREAPGPLAERFQFSARRNGV